MSDLDYVNIRSVNPLYFIIDEADGYIEKSNGNKYLTLVSNDKNKNILKIMQNYGVKLKIYSSQQLIPLMIMIKGIWKSNSIHVVLCLSLKYYTFITWQ